MSNRSLLLAYKGKLVFSSIILIALFIVNAANAAETLEIDQPITDYNIHYIGTNQNSQQFTKSGWAVDTLSRVEIWTNLSLSYPECSPVTCCIGTTYHSCDVGEAHSDILTNWHWSSFDFDYLDLSDGVYWLYCHADCDINAVQWRREKGDNVYAGGISRQNTTNLNSDDYCFKIYSDEPPAPPVKPPSEDEMSLFFFKLGL